VDPQRAQGLREDVVPYLLLIVEDPEMRRDRPPEDGQRAYQSMARFAEGLRSRGVLRANDSLTSSAVRVRVRDGKRSVVDGPFAESKEIIGGFFLLDCATREEAVAIAGECPATEWATVEVREIGPCWEATD
jgi:hypothetical protein